MKLAAFCSNALPFFSGNGKANLAVSNAQSSIAKLKVSAERRDLSAIKENLDSFCGDGGSFIINIENYQIQLCFKSKSAYQAAKSELAERIRNVKIDAIGNDQITKGKEILLQLTTSQSIALLGLNPYDLNDFQDSQKILKELHAMLEKYATFPISLPLDIFTRICSLLTLEDLSRFGRINKKISPLVNDIQIWQVVAHNFNVTINAQSTVSPKQQVHNALIIALPNGNINLLKKQIFLKESNYHTILKEASRIFEAHIPAGYFVKHYLNFGMHRVIYRDEDGKIKELTSPGREAKLDWGPGEKELWEKVQKTMKEVSIKQL